MNDGSLFIFLEKEKVPVPKYVPKSNIYGSRMSLTSLAEKRGVGLSKTQSISNLSFVSNATSRTSRMSKSKSTMNLSKVKVQNTYKPLFFIRH